MNIEQTVCKLCGEVLPLNTAKRKVGNTNIEYFCSDDCLNVLYPYATAPVMPGDMYDSECLAVDDPVAVHRNLDPYHIFTYPGGFQCPLEPGMPWSLWAVLFQGPQDQFFMVPWTGDDEDELDEVVYLPFAVQAMHDEDYVQTMELVRGVKFADMRQLQTIRLMLGRGVWQSLEAIEHFRHTRFRRIVADGVQKAYQHFFKEFLK